MIRRRRQRGTRLATGRQISYLRRLLLEAFSRLVKHGTGLDYNHLDGVSFAEASTAIDKLREMLGINREPRQPGAPVTGNDSRS